MTQITRFKHSTNGNLRCCYQEWPWKSCTFNQQREHSRQQKTGFLPTAQGKNPSPGVGFSSEHWDQTLTSGWMIEANKLCMFIYVYLCLSMFIYVYLCLSMFIYVYLCFHPFSRELSSHKFIPWVRGTNSAEVLHLLPKASKASRPAMYEEMKVDEHRYINR